MSKSHVRRRKNLWLQDPHCRDCGCLTILPEDCDYKNGKQPLNLATIEHTNSRYNSKRGSYQFKINTLLCYACNQKRNDIEQKTIPIDELHERSKRHPSKKTLSLTKPNCL